MTSTSDAVALTERPSTEQTGSGRSACFSLPTDGNNAGGDPLRARYLTLLDTVRGSYWFIPSMMTAGAVGLSLLTTALDRAIGLEMAREIGYIYTGGPQGARELFSMVGSSMITVAGVTFSITIVALTLASQQFGPRLLHNFMRDRGNQVVLGTYVATFTYCLLQLRTIRSTEETTFVPHISTTVAVVLAVTGLGVLIFYIHHVSTSIQVSTMIANVGKELDRSIDHLFPATVGIPPEGKVSQSEEDQVPDAFGQEAVMVSAKATGYLQMVEDDRLMQIATQRDLIIRLEHRPGKFVYEEIALAWVWPPDRLNEEVVQRIRHCLIIGEQRTKLQDAEFSINQLVEIAVRALSPGVNDPTTAIMCLDRLGAALTRLAGRDVPSSYRYDDTHQLRVIVDAPSFRGLANAALNEIRQYGASSVAVTVRLLEVIAIIASHIRTEEQRDTLTRQAVMIERDSRRIPEELDRADVEERFQTVMRRLRNESQT